MEVVTADELARVTLFLAQQAEAFASQAGVGSMETAGGFLSFLATHPDKCEEFLSAPLKALPANFWVHGCLSWHGADGKVFTPAAMRRLQGMEQ